MEHAAAEGNLADAQNQRLIEGNTQILSQVAALEARILSLEQTILARVSGAEPSTRLLDEATPRVVRNGRTIAGSTMSSLDSQTNSVVRMTLLGVFA